MKSKYGVESVMYAWYSEGVTHAWTEWLIKNYGRKELLLLYTANKTVEACTEWVSAFYRQNFL